MPAASAGNSCTQNPANRSSRSMMSNSSTSVSARLTNARLTNSSRSPCDRLITATPQTRPSLLHALGECQSAAHDIPGNVDEQPVVHVRVRPHPCQRLRGTDIELHGHHPGGLVDLGADRKSTRLNSSHMSISYA